MKQRTTRKGAINAFQLEHQPCTLQFRASGFRRAVIELRWARRLRLAACEEFDVMLNQLAQTRRAGNAWLSPALPNERPGL